MAERGNFFKKSIPSQRAEPGLITSKGYTSKELEAGEVRKPSFFYRQFLRNKDLYVRTLPRCKRCAQGGV
ncbi:hypothetical protein L249_5177, partial [Ophiocordyceps polyrhachis-furcata BCC 54312]